jgi:hypothetical protein
MKWAMDQRNGEEGQEWEDDGIGTSLGVCGMLVHKQHKHNNHYQGVGGGEEWSRCRRRGGMLAFKKMVDVFDVR